MKKKRRIRKRRKTLPLIGVIRDFSAYRKWIKTIRDERDNPNSKFNKYNLSHNYFYILYVTVTLPQEDAALPDNIRRLRLVESLTPVHQYLDSDLGFADYISPDFGQFYDEDNEPTLSYGITYRFAFKTFGLRWVVTRTLLLGVLLFVFTKWPILSTVWGWIAGA